MTRWRILLPSLTLLAAGLSAQQSQVSGSIRIRGRRGADALVKAWEQGFRKQLPGVTFDNQLRGNASAIGAVYTGAADIALMGREIWPIEVEGYDQALGLKPVPIAVVNAAALAVFVHKLNPLTRLSLVQLDAIFGADHRRGPSGIRNWGELGLTGDWTKHSLHLYGFRIAHEASFFFQQAVFLGSQKWNCALHEMKDGQEILDALARDPYGIAISRQTYKNPATKSLAIGTQESGYYEPARASIVARQYPLARSLWIVAGRPIRPEVKRFLDFLLSREGQDIVNRDGSYLPLSAASAEDERKKLQ